MSIIRPKLNIFIPPHIIKEEIDRVHRQDWEDPDRFIRQKQKALRYIPERAPTIKLFAWERLVREVARVFHDDLATDTDIQEAAQRACWAAERKHARTLEFADTPPELCSEPASTEPVGSERGPVRGVDDSEETLASLEWQLKEESDD